MNRKVARFDHAGDSGENDVRVQKFVTNKSEWLKNTTENQISQSRPKNFQVILKDGNLLNQTKAMIAANI